MEIQINATKRVQLEALTELYNAHQVYVQWLDMELIGADWNIIEGSRQVGLVADAPTYDAFKGFDDSEKLSAITIFIKSQQPDAGQDITVDTSLEVEIAPLPDGTGRIVQVYDMKINFAERKVTIYTRCMYSDNRDPKYIVLIADNATIIPGFGGGEYDYLFYRINTLKESLIDVQRESILMRSTPEGGAKWD